MVGPLCADVVSSYKALAKVERVFRWFNTDLDIRPIRHRTEERVRAHVFLKMLAYYVSFHMQAELAPMLFMDDDKVSAETARSSPVAPALRSKRALRTPTTRPTPSMPRRACCARTAQRTGSTFPTPSTPTTPRGATSKTCSR